MAPKTGLSWALRWTQASVEPAGGEGTAGGSAWPADKPSPHPPAAGCPVPEPPCEDGGGPRQGQQPPGPPRAQAVGVDSRGALRVGRRRRWPRDTQLGMVVGTGSPPPTPHRPLDQMGKTRSQRRGGLGPSVGSGTVAPGSLGSARPETPRQTPLRGLGSRSQPGRQQNHWGLPPRGLHPPSRGMAGSPAPGSVGTPQPRSSHADALHKPSFLLLPRYYGLPLS